MRKEVYKQSYEAAALLYAETYGILNYIVTGKYMIYYVRYPKGFEGIPRVRYYQRVVDLEKRTVESLEINWRRAIRRAVNRH